MIVRLSPNFRYLLEGAVNLAAPLHSWFSNEGDREVNGAGPAIEEQGEPMEDRDDNSPGQFWTEGDMMLQVQGLGREMDRIVKIRRPFALVGQSPDSDICLNEPGVSERHVYLHLDPRGLYVVDLLTRSGTRITST